MNPEESKNTGDLTKSRNTLGNSISSALFYLAILFFIIGFNFSDVMVGNWYQQFLPNINGRPLSDVIFLDSLNGYSITGDGTVGDTNYVLKTTNGGDNWANAYSIYRDLSKIEFINSSTGYISGGFNSSCAILLKTTNSGINWIPVNTPCVLYFNDLAVLSEDTIWLVGSNSFDGGVYRTTNGGANWDHQLNLGSQNPSKIYMFNSRNGFISNTTGTYLRKTTDSGQNWGVISSSDGFTDMYLYDSLSGFKANGNMKKTTNGGLNWVTQVLPQGGIIITSQILKFTHNSIDTVYGVGGDVFYGAGQFRGVIFKTTNGGNNWLFQVPDTSIHSGRYLQVQFINKLKGWAYWAFGGVRTVLGGDTGYTGIQQITTEIPNEYRLYQNYPNPFNPKTNIRYNVAKSNFVNLVIYDAVGRKIIDLINRKQNAGIYEIDFSGNGLVSGVYFYSLIVNGSLIDTRKMILLK